MSGEEMVRSVAGVKEMLALIREDCNADALALDGAPFDGRTVAKNFGHVLAMVYALAEGLDVVCAELERRNDG